VNVTNEDRAEWAADALRHIESATGTDYADSLSDLLCDLLHWSDRESVNFQEALDTAYIHYEAECQEEEFSKQNPKDYETSSVLNVSSGRSTLLKP
jgi:hypothetical protein